MGKQGLDFVYVENHDPIQYKSVRWKWISMT